MTPRSLRSGAARLDNSNIVIDVMTFGCFSKRLEESQAKQIEFDQ
jgi:hypothetical protein